MVTLNCNLPNWVHLQTKLVLLTLMLMPYSWCSKILFLPPMVSPSHKFPIIAWADAMAARGHDVLIWAPSANKTDNYRPKLARLEHFAVTMPTNDENEKVLSVGPEAIAALLAFDPVPFFIPGGLAEPLLGYLCALPLCESIIQNPELRPKFDAVLTEKWDLVIVDEIFNPCGYLISTLANTSARGVIVTTKSTQTAPFHAGIPSSPSHVPAYSIIYGFTDRMSFLQRAANTWFHFTGLLSDTISSYLETRRFRQLFPNLSNIQISRQNPAILAEVMPRHFEYPRPYTHHFVTMAGLSSAFKSNIDTTPLPKELEDLISQTDGFVLVATGHLAKWELAKPEVLDAFVSGFSRLPKTIGVIWQFLAPNELILSQFKLPPNIKLVKWMPQKALLAHPKIRVFLSHCGANSVNEALQFAVPVLGFPLFADQGDGAIRIASRGAGLFLHKPGLSADKIYDGIMEMLQNNSYAQAAKRLQKIVSDVPADGLKHIVHWTELAAKYGSSHYRKSTRSEDLLPSWKHLCLDCILFLVLCLTVGAFLGLKLMILLWRVIVESNKK